MNKNKRIDFEPIKIKIKDRKLFADVAFAIDSPFFIRRAKQIREKLNISEPFRKKDCYLWIAKNLIKKKGKKFVKEIYEEIDNIRFEMNLTVNYECVFLKAVFGCDIEDLDYESTYLINFQDPPAYICYSRPKSELYAIVLTPQTQEKDVEKLYKKYKETIAKSLRKEEIFDNFDFGKGKLKRTRKWYWIRYGDVLNGKLKKPKTYPKTLEEWWVKCPLNKIGETHKTDRELKKCPYCSITDWNIMETLVPIYKKRLKNPEG